MVGYGITVPLRWDTAALSIACRQERATSGVSVETLYVAMQAWNNSCLAMASVSTCQSSSGCSHLVATIIDGRPEFVSAATVTVSGALVPDLVMGDKALVYPRSEANPESSPGS